MADTKRETDLNVVTITIIAILVVMMKMKCYLYFFSLSPSGSGKPHPDFLKLVSFIGVSVALKASFPLCFLLHLVAHRPVKMPAAWRISTGHGSKIPGVTIALHGRLTGRHLATRTHVQ